MSTKRWTAVVTLFVAVSLLGQTTGLEVTGLSVSKSTLGKNKTTKVKFALPSKGDPMNWEMSCDNAEIQGWESPKPVNITERNSSGNIASVRGSNFPSGTRLMMNLKRPESAKKAESGKCKLTVFPVSENGPKDADQGSYITLFYK